MSENELRLGQLVKSKAGRDKDKYLIILEVIDQNYVNLADGDLRKVENPKKKKIKHLTVIDCVAEEIAEVLAQGRMPLNEEVRQAIAKIMADLV